MTLSKAVRYLFVDVSHDLRGPTKAFESVAEIVHDDDLMLYRSSSASSVAEACTIASNGRSWDEEGPLYAID